MYPQTKLIQRLARKFHGILNLGNELRSLNEQMRALKDLYLFQYTRLLQRDHPNPLNKFGKKCFSQTDEDGITLEILRRLNKMVDGVFAEFGVGNGTENNTLLLLALGWKGFWVGSDDLQFQIDDGERKRLCYRKEWITLENVVELAMSGLSEIGEQEIDVMSLDLDGNDIFFVERLLTNQVRPKLFIVEYNAKFPPPVEFQITYDPQHTWKNDDYFGASLSSYNRLFNRFDYRLICCNSHTGSDAFFIDEAYSQYFSDVPTDISQIFVEPRYHLYNTYGHKTAIKTIEKVVNSN